MANITPPPQFWNEWEESNYKPVNIYLAGSDTFTTAYQNPDGTIWSEIPYYGEEPNNPKLLVSGEVASDPFIKTLGLATQNPDEAKALYNLKQTNPNEYYKQAASKLGDFVYNDWKYNYNDYKAQVARQQLESIKDVAPDAYYTTKLADLGRSMGWQIGQNRNDRNAPTMEQIKALVPEAQKAGLSAEQINSIVGNNLNLANTENQQRIANEAASGNFWSENLLGALKVGALGLGAMGLDNALAAGVAEAAAPTYTGMDAAANAYLGGSSGAFIPAEGFSATLPGFGATTPIGMDAYVSAAFNEPIGAFVPAEGFSATLPGFETVAPIGDQIGDYPMPGESGTASQWTPSNINPQDVTNLLDYNAAYANGGLNLSDALSAANKARQIVGAGSSIAKLLGGGGTGSTSGGLDLTKLAGALKSTPTFNPINLQQIQPKNPFFYPNQGTLGGEDIYDVSGSNLANALRNK